MGQTLGDLNVDVEASGLALSGIGGFGFAPAKDGWTV